MLSERKAWEQSTNLRKKKSGSTEASHIGDGRKTKPCATGKPSTTPGGKQSEKITMQRADEEHKHSGYFWSEVWQNKKKQANVVEAHLVQKR